MKRLRLQPGDRVRLRPTLEVVAVHDHGLVSLRSQDGDISAELETRHLEIVRPAKAKVGDVITARQIHSTWWKRGTVFRSLLEFAPEHWLLVVTPSGRLFAPGHNSDLFFEFDELLELPEAQYEVVYVA